MSDLAELFKPNTRSPQRLQPSASILSAASQQTISSPAGSSAAPRTEWQLSSLEASLRKGVRREVSAETMKEELRAFFTLQKEVFTRRAGIIGGIILLLWIFSDISGSHLFTLLLLVGTQMLTAQALPFSEPTLNTNIRRLQPLIYCTLFYSLLKWLNEVPTRQIDWPTTYLAVTATLLRSVIIFYDGFLAISTRPILASALGKRKALGKLLLFPKIVIYRARMLLGMGKHLVVTASMLIILASGVFYFFNKLSFDCLQLNCLLKTLGVFLALQLFLDFVWFVNISFSQNAVGKVMRDKMPIYLSLLRLEYTPANRLVQLDCLKVLYVKLEQDGSFLTTDTYKSLLYSTYMDVFNQFATAELERATSQLTAFITKAKLNDKTLTSQKTPLQDILVYFRKGAAIISSEWQASRALQLLVSLSFLLLIVQKVEGNTSEEESDVRVSRRVIALIRSIREELQQSVERSSLSSYTRGELTSVLNGWRREEFFMGN